MFKYLVLFSAFLIEAIGTYVSIVGLSSLFAANLIIITLAGALDLGKIVSVSFLFKHFKTMNVIMRTYLIAATFVLMMITSAGAFGYLSGEFQRAISDTNQTQVIKQALEEEQTRLQARKMEIDSQIAKLPDNSVRGRTALMKQFAPEVSKINERLIEIDSELPKLKIEAIKKGVEVGPIIYIAEAFNTTPEQAVKWVIMVIIFVFDPLAVTLLLAGNFLFAKEKEEKEEKELRHKNRKLEEEDPDITVVPASMAYAKPAENVEVPVTESPTVEVTELKIETPKLDDTPTFSWGRNYDIPESPSLKNWSITVPEEKVEAVVEEPVVEEEIAKPIETPVEESALLKKDESPVEPVEEQVVQEPRQVIKLSDVNHVVHRSSLEDVDARRGDVETAEGFTHVPPSLKRIYSE